MIIKKPILPHRVRQVPRSFSWIDHRLVRERHLDCCSHEAAALYLFLVCVGDSRGLSYYGDKSISKRLSMKPDLLASARSELIRNNLLAWERPVYQVLSLEARAVENRSASRATRLGEILNQAREEVSHD